MIDKWVDMLEKLLMTLGLSEYECFVGLIAFVGLFNRLKMHSEKKQKSK